MRLETLHPHVANRDCQLCVKFFFEESGPQAGQMRVDRQGRPLDRPRGTHPPCRAKDQTCPKGTPERQVKLTSRNRQFWEYFKRCKLTGRWPEDEWFLSLAVALDETIQDIQLAQQIQLVQLTQIPRPM